ncbi:MAG: radical SAM protein [Pirellulales bacterium]
MRQFVSWIEAHDEHASAHLRLLEQATMTLEAANGQTATCVLDPALADRLERWRYHILSRHAGALHPTDQRLADALDLAARKLAGGPYADQSFDRRSPRQALESRPGRDAVRRWFDSEAARRELVRRATELTIVHHSVPTDSGVSKRSMLLYAPLYLSNYCVNFCDYCYFRYPQPLERSHLQLAEVLQQAEILRDRAIHHLLLVAGDYPKLVTPAYLCEIVSALVARDFSVAVEIAPQSTACYAQLVEAGACGVTLYQEIYDEPLYAEYHSRGTKASFDWRLEGLDRAAEAGMRHLGMGVLLGLGDPLEELACTIGHGQYLQKRFPGIQLSFGLPRLHDVPTGFRNRSETRAEGPPRPEDIAKLESVEAGLGSSTSQQVDDRMFGLLYSLLRVVFPEAQLVLSTRETESLRRELIQQCITQISAGSSTSPGGYTQTDAERQQSEQFPISDERSPAEVAQQLDSDGFHVQWQLAEPPRLASGGLP